MILNFILFSEYRRSARILPMFACYILLAWGLTLPASWASSLIYKNYLIRYDRGWDILCEPYVVRQGDWVLKIFRQKGEIAHTDFREFLSIFQRLNPHIRDIDMIRPGQTVDIPLRKLEHGSLPGQASGVVTIPFVALTQVDELIVRHSKQYEVQWGDTVSELLSRKYGHFGSLEYSEAVKLFKAANPQITNLDRIYAGQKVYLPDPDMRDESWYANIYDEQGNIRQAMSSQSAGLSPGAEPVVGLRPQAPAEEQAPLSPLAEAAAAVGGTLSEKGTYFVPRPDGGDFEVDLSRHPLLTLDNASGAPGVVFTQTGEVMGAEAAAVEQFWDNTKVVSYDPTSSAEDIVDSIFQAIEGASETDQPAVAEAGFTDRGIQITVRAKWIRPINDGRKICIIPIATPNQRISEDLRRYLEQHDIVLKEMLPGKKEFEDIPLSTPRHSVLNILDLAPVDQRTFVQDLAKALGYHFTPKVAINFPYAGVMVQAYANLFSTGQGREVLVDFGDLYGDALEAIRSSGPAVVQISADDDYGDIVRNLLSGLGQSYDDNPSFLAIPGAKEYNTVVTVAGVMLSAADNRKTLLTGVPLPVSVSELVSAHGAAIVQW